MQTIRKEFLGLKMKTYSYSKDSNDEDKNATGTKKYIIKRKLIYQGLQKLLRSSLNRQQNKLFKKKKFDVDSPKEDQKEFIKNNKLILKSQPRFKRERHNVFTEEINKIDLSSNDEKRMQPIDSIETYAYGTSVDLICKKDKT